MRPAIRAPKDFWIGIVYASVGAAALWLGRDYPFGTAGRMGPGYFPRVLATVLLGLGLLSLVLSFRVPGEPIGRVAWAPLGLVLLACLLFAVLLPRTGLVVALLALCLVSAAASDEFRFEARAAIGLVALVTACALGFVKGLGVPMPLLGSWLEPVLGPLLPWLL